MDYKDKFRKRILMHKGYVEHFYDIAKHSNELITYPETDFNIKCHDDDKLESPHFELQARRMIDEPWYDFRKDPEVIAEVRWHVNNQPHHPQYWNKTEVVDPFKEPVDCSDMPYTYLIEMACDWMAMAKEKNEGPFDWYNKTVGTRFIFDDMQKKYIYNMFTILGKELEQNVGVQE